MINVMIIDDEPIILDKLRNIIDWQELDCHIVAEADNGIKALELCSQYKPQIIVCDICMPHMDGLVFSEELKKILPQSVIILISGFDDFTYAQKAITTGVFRYLLKPIRAKELREIITEAKDLVLLREEEAEEKERLKKLINKSLPTIREKFFADLIKGELGSVITAEQLNFLQLRPKGELFGVINAHLDNLANLAKSVEEEELQLYKFHLLKMLKNSLQTETEFLFAFINKPQEIIVVYGINNHQQIEELYHKLLQVQERFFKTYNLTFSAGIGGVYQELSSIKDSYQEANLALDFKMWTGTNALIPYGDLKASHAGRLLYSQEHEVIASALREGDQEKAAALIKKVFTTLGSQDGAYVAKGFLQLTVLDVVNQITRTLLEFGGKITDLEEIFGGEFNPLEEVKRYETLDSLEDWVQGLNQRGISYINRHKQEVSKNFVEKARRYLEENFANPELNLSIVADYVYVSPCYLSHLFKEVTGNNVTEYLNRVRIHQAKQLLKETNMKIYEISERVGFRDSHYFGIVFKKIMGLSPGEYRDKVRIDDYL